MTNDEMILALSPNPEKKGTRVSRVRYDITRAALIEILQANGGEMPFTVLRAAMEAALVDKLDGGNPTWYFMTVKLDLEARGVLTIRRGKPQQTVILN